MDMNMAGMHPGNPAVRGGMPAMNNNANGMQMRHEETNYAHRLNAFIYGYFLDKGMWECARALKDSGAGFEPPLVPDNDINGADEKIDSKDNIGLKKPDDLPRNTDDNGTFLLSWFELFWDIYFAQRRNARATHMAQSFIQLSQAQAKRTDQQQQQMLRAMPGMMPGAMDLQNQMLARQNHMMGMGNPDLRQRVLQQQGRLQPSNPQQMAQMMRQQQQAQQQQQMMQNQMRRDGSEMNGQRPRTPSGADHAPSPSKRQRLDGVPFNGNQMIPNGRGMPSGMPGNAMMQDPQAQQANQLLMNNGINPANLSESQFHNFLQLPRYLQQKSIQIYAENSPRNVSQQGDDVLKQGGFSDQGSPMAAGNMDLATADFFAQNPAAAAIQMRNGGMPPQPGANGAGGNHALQDYQMQLMLLEQQNKKRLLMARQEQDSMSRPEGQPPMPGQTAYPPGMSPSGSRGGPSPQPDQRRGTPQMGQPVMPGSPMPTGSPAPLNFNNVDPALFNQMNGRMQPPPSSNPAFNGPFNQMEAMQRAQQQAGNRMPNGSWPQGPQGQASMVPQGQQPPQPAAIGTPQQRNEMPPPQGVPASNNNSSNNNANGRTSSPAPPTPQQTNKANPKGKKDAKDRKKPTKKNTASGAAATPASEAENPPATPTPSTPITPSGPNPFNKAEGQSQPNAVGNAAAAAPAPIVQPQPDANANAPFTMDGAENGEFGINAFNNDLLENFDFEQFLQGDFPYETTYETTDGALDGVPTDT